ncbi:hypothetical protein BDB01DRAFT_803579 [Pilobolus umbonatus]|nr:hypothetical protein BDB01DRAFT_803579 [Pilobolus umbonatus]
MLFLVCLFIVEYPFFFYSLPMPTTRSTHPNTKETMRQNRYLLRKEREINPDMPKKQQTMCQFIQTLIRMDKRYILCTETPHESIESIENRVYKGKYHDFVSLKSSLDTLLKDAVPTLTREDYEEFKKLTTFIDTSIRLEAERNKERVPEKTERVEMIALFRPTMDGYVFSDSTMKQPSATPTTDLPNHVYEMVVHPTTSSEDIPTLKEVVAPPPKLYKRMPKHEDKVVVPVQWLDFGAFSSFAPATDSNNANVSYESTCMGRTAKRAKTTTDDMAWLKEQGIEIDWTRSSDELEENSELIRDLLEYQDRRFESGKSVDEEELSIAKKLENNLSSMLSRLPPDATTHPATIEHTMERLPLHEPCYRGTLPSHKPFSFPTSDKAENIPPYANMTPTYAKEHWACIRVPDAPMSMVEQQMSLFAKPIYYPPPRK